MKKREENSQLEVLIKEFFSWLFRRPTNRQIDPVDTARMNFDVERLKPDPGDSHELLLNKASRLIENYFALHELSIPPSHTCLDVARHLESLNMATPAGLGADPALNLLLELHNPASELYIEATRLLLSWF